MHGYVRRGISTRGRALDQERREQRRQIEEGEAWRRGLDRREQGLSGYRLNERRQSGGDRHVLRQFGPRLCRNAGIADLIEIPAAGTGDVDRLIAIVVLGLTDGMAVLREHGSRCRGKEADDKCKSRAFRSQTSHDVPIGCTESAIEKGPANRSLWQRLPENRKNSPGDCGIFAYAMQVLPV